MTDKYNHFHTVTVIQTEYSVQGMWHVKDVILIFVEF